MNKIDLFFAKHLWLTYIIGFVIVPLLVGKISILLFDFHEAWQYSFIGCFIFGYFLFGPKVKKYKEFNKEQLTKDILNKNKEFNK